jgi:hypothetical protein
VIIFFLFFYIFIVWLGICCYGFFYIPSVMISIVCGRFGLCNWSFSTRDATIAANHAKNVNKQKPNRHKKENRNRTEWKKINAPNQNITVLDCSTWTCILTYRIGVGPYGRTAERRIPFRGFLGWPWRWRDIRRPMGLTDLKKKEWHTRSGSDSVWIQSRIILSSKI